MSYRLAGSYLTSQELEWSDSSPAFPDGFVAGNSYSGHLFPFILGSKENGKGFGLRIVNASIQCRKHSSAAVRIRGRTADRKWGHVRLGSQQTCVGVAKD